MEFRILGALEVRDGDRVLPITGPKKLRLLSVLLLRANEVVPLEFVIDELWPDNPPQRAEDAVQQLVYELRKTLEGEAPRGSVLEWQGNGYRLLVGRDQLDLQRFERLVRAAEESKRDADLDAASWTLREALALWRGPALGNVKFEPGSASRAEADRLDRLRLNAMVEQIETDLELDPDGELIGQIEALAADNPVDERLRELLMLGLYRVGRQADALQAYQDARSILDELGLEPGKQLQLLQQQILRHDPDLEAQQTTGTSDRKQRASVAATRAVVAAGFAEHEIDGLLPLGESLGRSQEARELILLFVVSPGDDAALSRANAAVRERLGAMVERGSNARVAAFTSRDAGADIARLASREDVDLLLLACPQEVLEQGVMPGPIAHILAEAPCDVGLLVARATPPPTGPVVVPFGGLEHDWSALEIGAWAASATGSQLALVGVRGRPEEGHRDASRILADASLIVQQELRIAADVRLVDAGREDEFLESSNDAQLLVVGLPERWRRDGIGPLRLALTRDAAAPVLLVKRGPRPGGLAPRETATVFSWSLLPLAREASSQLSG